MLKLWSKIRNRQDRQHGAPQQDARLAQLFDEKWYFAKYSGTGQEPGRGLDHYLRLGFRNGYDPSPLFDTQWYAQQVGQTFDGAISPIEHYLNVGAAQAYDPCFLFDTDWYLQKYPDVRQAGLNPLAHFIHFGAKEGRDPCAYFSTLWYRYQYEDVRPPSVNPLVHYLEAGAAEGRNPSPEFDSKWYLAQYPDVKASGGNPLLHYIAFGRGENRIPSPAKATMGGYEGWIQRHEALNEGGLQILRNSVPALRSRPVFSIVTPTYNTPLEFLTAFIESVRAQVYPDWELCIADDASTELHVRDCLENYARTDPRIKLKFRATNGHIAEATNTALDMAQGDYICLMDHDDEISPDALYEFAIRLNADPGLDFIYSDEDKITETGRRYEPFFKPDWSPEALESCMYTAHFACYRTSLVRETGGFRKEFNGAQDYEFVLRFTERALKVAHVPKVLYHWRAIPGSTAASMDNKDYVIDAGVRALEGRLARTGTLEWVKPNFYKGCFDVRRAISGEPKVSIVIPSAGRDSVVRGQTTDLLVHCVTGIFSKSTYRNFEIIVVHNGDLRTSTIEALAEFPLSFVQYDDPVFNIAKKINLGARHATGEYTLFLNDDIEVISEDWLEAMLSIAQNPDVGAVGARLYFEDGGLQHVGIAFWNGLPDHIRRGFQGDDPGHFFSTVGQRNYLAVTGACIMSRTDYFNSIGGWDESFAVNYNDIDYCLRLYKQGLRIVYAPQAELFHFESRNRERTVSEHEAELFLERWADFVAYDPYYSPYFGDHPPNFRLRDGV